MGCQESLEFYLNLSRKELQGLCKTHNLPANRSHVQLAKSLSSFFKKKNAITTSSKERSSSPVEASFNTSSLPESKPKEAVYPPEEGTRDVVGAFERKTDSSESDSYRPVSSIKEMVGDDRPQSQIGSQLEINNHMESQTLKKAYEAAEEVVCPYPVSGGATEGFGCSTSEPGVVGMRPSVAADIQENTRSPRLDLECQDGITRNETQKSSPPKISSQIVLNHAATDSGPSSFTLVPSRQHRTAECSIESGLVLSDETSIKASPSFQFFATSEEGINLYVDLNSNPSEWINSLKNEVNICQKAHHHNSRSISNHIRDLADINEHTKIPSSGIRVDLQSDGVERNTGCTNSSLSSVVSENCHSEAYAPDGTAVTSRSSVLTSSSAPIEISGCFEGNQMISSSCITYSNVQNQMAFDVASCPGDGKVLPQDSVDASFRMEKSNASVLDASLKSIGNIDVLSPDGTKSPDPMDCHCLKIDTVDSNKVEASVLGNTHISISEKNSLSMPDGSQNKMEVSDIGNLEKDSSARQVSVEKGLTEVLSGVASRQNRSSDSSQLDGKLVSDCPATDAQSDAGSANHLLSQQACGGLGNSVTEDPVSSINDELGGGIAVREKERPECLEFQYSLGKSYKRSHSSEFPEEFPSKRQHANNENKSGAMMNLRSTKNWAKETIHDPVVLPRRSTRLVSK